MSDRAVVTLRTQADRDKASRWCQGVATGSKVVFHGPARTLPQNDLFWSCMGDVSRQHEYHGLKLSPEDWRTLFMDALDREARMVPNLDGDGLISLGRSSSALSKEEFSNLISTVFEWGNRNGIEWSDKP
mgnify:FL=1